MPDELSGTTSETPVDQRNLQLNPGGDPAREKQFLEEQEQKTGDFARASQSQLVSVENPELTEAIKGADILDPTEKKGYEAPDAPPGSEQGAHVNAEFEDNVRTGAGAEGDPGGEVTDPNEVSETFGVKESSKKK